MDPNETLKLMLKALNQGYADEISPEAAEYAANLANWIKSGGFMPAMTSAERAQALIGWCELIALKGGDSDEPSSLDNERRATVYKIVRIYENPNKPNRTVKRRLTLAEAQAHCRDPETSSKTCTSYAGRRRTNLHGAWFDGYTEI